MFSVCTILYGDYPELARRILSSIEGTMNVKDIRIGLNNVSNTTLQFVHTWAEKQKHKQPIFILQEQHNCNLGKYPLMRQLFQFEELAPYIMWFDDDSYVDETAGIAWWEEVAKRCRLFTQLGAVHFIRQRKQQYIQIKQQPWYTEKPIDSRHVIKFITGGWWVLESEIYRQWDYPFVDIHHNGGDSILGELLRQQNKTLGHSPDLFICHCESCIKKHSTSIGVHINVGGRAGRRGIGASNEVYVWENGEPVIDYNFQKFTLKANRYEV